VPIFCGELERAQIADKREKEVRQKYLKKKKKQCICE